jgi:hypothetical protein
MLDYPLALEYTRQDPSATIQQPPYVSCWDLSHQAHLRLFQTSRIPILVLVVERQFSARTIGCYGRTAAFGSVPVHHRVVRKDKFLSSLWCVQLVISRSHPTLSD